jgi:uncharacterized protein YeaO (DUF488 family)
MPVRIKRAYDDPEPDDGTRVLVDRLWPRGVSKEEARLEEWLKSIAPSDELREWFDHDEAKFDEFERRYRAELAERSGAVEKLLAYAEDGTLTLVYGAADREHNNAVVLRDYLRERLAGDGA